MQFFDDIHKFGNIFSFYESLTNASNPKFKQEYLCEYANTIEDSVDGDMIDYFGGRFPNIDDYFRYISKMQSRYLFHSIESGIEEIKDITEKKTYWQTNRDKIDYYLHKAKSNKDIVSQEDFICDLVQIKKDIEIRFPELLKMGEKFDQANEAKVIWLGTTKQLASLFYDLWQGQKKIKGKTIRPLIKASKGDLINLLINNFLDKENQPLNKSTLSDYLNTSESKSNQRASFGAVEGGRIELDYE